MEDSTSGGRPTVIGVDGFAAHQAGGARDAAQVARRRSAPIERASAADLALLAMETGGAVPEHLGAVFVLDARHGFDVGSAQRVLAERIRAVPRLRQRLVRPPLGCGRPVWVDDPGFDAARHVRLRRCAAPGDEQALLDVAADVISEPLPRSRPLWAAAFVSGLVGGQVGLVLVLHHVLADGIDGLAILARLVDAAEPGPTRSFPQPCPTRRRLAAEAFRSRLRSLGRFRAGARALRTTMAGGSGGPVPRAVACSILHVTGTRRRFAASAPSWPHCAQRGAGTVAPSTTCSSPRWAAPCTHCWSGGASRSRRSGWR